MAGAIRAGWSLALVVACSRTALQDPERASVALPNQAGGGAPQARGGSPYTTESEATAPGGSAGSTGLATGGIVEARNDRAAAAGRLEGAPEKPSRRWVAISAPGRDGKNQIYGLRFGPTEIEDWVRLDPATNGYADVQGKFGPNGRGYALRVEERADFHAQRLIDFGATKPRFVDFPPASAGHLNQFGPWLDDHRIVAYAKVSGASFAATDCRVVDLDHVDSPMQIGDFGISGALCSGNFDISPSRRWLYGFANVNEKLVVMITRVTPEGLSGWTRLVELPEGQYPVRATYNYDESYMYLQKSDLQSHTIVGDVDIVRLSDPPEVAAAFSLPADEQLNYVVAAPSGSRFLTHTTRISSSGRGTNPIRIVDAATGASSVVTQDYTAAYSEGFTRDGLGVVVEAYAPTSVNGNVVNWLDLSAASKPPETRKLTCSNGAESFGGRLMADGGSRYAICGNSTRGSYPIAGPVTLEVHRFTPALSGPELVAKLTEHATLTDVVFSDDNTALIYCVLPALGTNTEAFSYKSELGTFFVSMSGGVPRRLPLAWSEGSTIWLPNAAGLLRIGRQDPTATVADATWAEHWALNDSLQNATYTMHWLRFDGPAIGVVDLTPYLASIGGSGSARIEVPDSWVR